MGNTVHRYKSEVAFSDTDASGWAHFSKILTYVERAEHDALALAGISVFDEIEGGWPRVRVTCDYRSPLKFQEKFEVRLVLKKIGTSSLNWQFEIFKSGEFLVAEGEMVSVKVSAAGSPKAFSETERAKLESLS